MLLCSLAFFFLPRSDLNSSQVSPSYEPALPSDSPDFAETLIGLLAYPQAPPALLTATYSILTNHMIIDAVEDNSNSKSTTLTNPEIAASTIQDGLFPVGVPPPYTYEQHLHLAIPSHHTHLFHSTPNSDDMLSPDPSSPLLPPSPQSQIPSQRRLYPHPILRVTTIPYDFYSSNSHERSSLPSHTSSATRPTRRAFARFFTSFFVALGIIFLWLLFVQCIGIVIFGHPGRGWGRSPHHGPPPPHGGHGRRRDFPVVKPSFGTSRPYVAYSTRYGAIQCEKSSNHY